MVPIFIVIIVGLTLVALVPMFFSIFTGPGVTTEPINADKTKPASTEVDGEWKVASSNMGCETTLNDNFKELDETEDTSETESAENKENTENTEKDTSAKEDK